MASEENHYDFFLGAGEDKMFRESSLIREKQYVSE
jgi:hypothetical protein